MRCQVHHKWKFLFIEKSIYEPSSLDVFTMFPSPESWKQDDRQVVCAVYDSHGLRQA